MFAELARLRNSRLCPDAELPKSFSPLPSRLRLADQAIGLVTLGNTRLNQWFRRTLAEARWRCWKGCLRRSVDLRFAVRRLAALQLASLIDWMLCQRMVSPWNPLSAGHWKQWVEDYSQLVRWEFECRSKLASLSVACRHTGFR